MTTFWIVAGLLVLTALLFVIPPLLERRVRKAGAKPSELNLSIFRDQLRELDEELAAGTIDTTQYSVARSELEGRVIEDTAAPESPAAVTTGSRWPAAVVMLALPVVSVLLYLWLGNPQWAEVRDEPEKTQPPHALTTERIQSMANSLAQRLEQQPGDAEGWVMLARSYAVLRQFREAGAAYAKAAQLRPNDAQLLADYADVLAMANGRTLQGEPEKIIQQALKADQNNIKALALAGSAMFERKDYQGAIDYWQRILLLEPSGSQTADSVSASLDEARKLAGMGPAEARPATGQAAAASVSGKVQLDPALKGQAAESDTVFIFVREAGGRRGGPPLAIMRKTVRELPLSFTLDDSMSMSPASRLSSAAQVIVGARVSKSGNALPAPGDLEGYSQPVKVGAKDVSIVISATVK